VGGRKSPFLNSHYFGNWLIQQLVQAVTIIAETICCRYRSEPAATCLESATVVAVEMKRGYWLV